MEAFCSLVSLGIRHEYLERDVNDITWICHENDFVIECNLARDLVSCALTTSKMTSKGSSSNTPADVDLEQLLSREASAFQREVEVERILKAFKLK